MHMQRKVYQQMLQEISLKNDIEDQHKVNENNQENMSNEASLIANMEIPGELAHVLSKDQSAIPVHADHHITTVAGTVVPIDMKYELPNDINAHPFTKYVGVYFKNQSWAVMSVPIRDTFLSLNNEISKKHALSIFKLILRFMADSKMADRRKKIIADYIIQKCLQDEQLRDEIYCQLVNQTWKNPVTSNSERGWFLLAFCLCSIIPSNTLKKYLLKYVSDLGYNGYKEYCQHKLLQSFNIRPSLCRTYPPCLLEWKAALRKSNMALTAKFPDDDIQVGHVDSWTTGEKFAAHLLDQRNMYDNHSGWTVVLEEGPHYYELMGNDYVLDLISEIEIVTGFPVCKSFTFVYTDRTAEPVGRKASTNKPHDPERDRTMTFTGNFPEILPLEASIQTNAKRSKKDIALSLSNPLNQRRAEDFLPDLTSESPLNNRYHNYKLRAASPLSSVDAATTNGSVIQAPSNLNRDSQLNKRYMSSSPVNINETDIANSKLNARYTERTSLIKAQPLHLLQESVSARSDDRTSNWAKWVDNVFENVLNDNVDDLSDARSLESRIKGGGNGLTQNPQTTIPLSPLLAPTQAIQSNFFPPLTVTTPTLNAPVTMPISTGILSPIDPMQLAAAQMAAQQLAAQQQQQTQQQALAQALYNQMQQQAQQQNLVQAALQQQQQQQQQQTALYQAALQQQQITQMQTQLQQNPTLFLNSGNLLNSPPLIEETSATTLNTSVKAPPKVFPKPVGKRYKEHTNDEVVTRNSNLFNQPSYVLKSSQRSQQTSITNGTAESTEDDEEDNKEAASLSSSGKVTAYVTRVSGISNKVKRVGSSVSSKSVQVERQTSQDVTINGHVVSPTEPLLASSSSQSNRFSFPEPQKQQQQPPPPPPPPPPPAQIPDEEKIPGTFRNLKGTIRHVRVGKVVWPPPTQEFKKLTVEVGKLEIDENLANEFNRKIGEGGKKRRIPSGKELKDEGNQTTLKKTETSKSHSLTNTSHLATIKMLERKLSCKDAQTKSDSSESEEEVKAPVTARLNMIPKAPPIPSSSPLTTESQTSEVMDTTVLENTKTRLYPQVKELFLTYQDIPCTLRLRKEVFSPKQKLDYAAILNLVFCQVVRDVFNSGLIRINKEQRVKMRSLLESHGVNQRNFLTVTLREQLKRIIVDTAKEWPTYFCRLYPVACPSSYSTVKYLGVSHSGVYMIAREQTFIDEQLSVVESFKFEDIVEVVLRSNNIVQLTLRHKGVLLYTKWDKELKKMIDEYRHENERGSKVAFALKDYIVDRPTLLSFRSKDVIKLMDAGDPLDEGWLYGSLNGNVGFFPEECVRIMPQHEVLTASREPQVLMNGHTDNRSDSSSMSAVAEGNFPMLEYATHHFRESLNRMQMLKTGMSPSEWTEKDQAEMVKWTKSPIHASLLMLSNKELNQLALESFTELMTFMGDLPQNKRDTQCALRILRICHKYPELRDEVYCQLCKQTTNNTSSKAKSLIRGWRFFSLYAAYNDCSSTLRPYLLKYLTIAATDTSDPNNICTVADICLKNLRKTLRYGGRKNVPLEEEITNLSEGRMTKTQLFSFFGMTNPKHSVEVRSSTLVKDIIEEIGQRLGIIDTVELEEYTLFLVINSGKPNVRYHRISRQEYFFDITADLQKKPTPYDVVFQRAVWNFPIRPTTNEIYINLMFYQSIPNFLDGYLILSKNGLSSKDPGFINELAMMASLLHRSQDERTMPVMKGLKTLLPQTVLDAKILKPQQWLNKIHEETNKISTLSPFQSKAHFLNILSKWKLFGSTFFKLKSIPPNIGECYLAINRHGIQILTKDDRETIVSYEFSEILSTRRYNSENNKSYLDMKLGNLMAQKISRVETDECSAISNLIGQYMHVINLHKKRQGPLHPSVPS